MLIRSIFPKLFIVLSFFHLSLFGMGNFLMPDEAFKPYVKKIDESHYEAGVKIAKDIYLYDKSLSVEINASNVVIKDIQRPTPVEHHEDMVFLESPKLKIELAKKDYDANAEENVSIILKYQGCSEAGLCYEPYQKSFVVSVDTKQLKPLNAPKKQEKIEKKVEEQTQLTPVAQEGKSQQDIIADTIKNSSLLVILASFFVFGILLSLTPCVFPMIPILSGVIISQGEGITTKKAFFLSLVYVLSMAIAYSLAGVLSGYFGSNMQAALQTPWVVYSFAVIFVLLALSMFGLYELKLPDALVSKVSARQGGGGYGGVAVMGFLSALIVGPCVAAPLAGALVYIGQTGDALLGGIALFVMALGMGLPLILVGMSAGKLMPRPGSWMTMVNIIFGFIMLGVAVWMLSKVLGDDVIMFLYALLGIGFSIYFGVFENGVHVLKKSIGFIVFVYSLALFIGVMGGSTDMFKPLKVYAKNSGETQKLEFTVVTSLEELQAVLQKNKNKKVMLDFSAQWCVACKELEEKTFRDPQVIEALQEYVLIRADITKNTEVQKELSSKYGVFGPPVIIFMDEKHNVLNAKRIVGYVPPKEFLALLP